MPPVSQTLPATQSLHSPASTEGSLEKPQSNGTAEVKSPTKPETQENHVSLPRDKSPMPPNSPEPIEKIEEEPSPMALPDQKPQESIPVEERKASPEPAATAVSSPPTATPAPPTESAPTSAETEPEEIEPKLSESPEPSDSITEESSSPKEKEVSYVMFVSCLFIGSFRRLHRKHQLKLPLENQKRPNLKGIHRKRQKMTVKSHKSHQYRELKAKGHELKHNPTKVHYLKLKLSQRLLQLPGIKQTMIS